MDRRIIFAMVFICLIIPYIVNIKLPQPIDGGTQGAYDTIERLYEENKKRVEEGKPKKIAIVCCDWEASTKAECWPITMGIMAHLYSREIPFALLSFFPEGPRFAQFCLDDLQKQGIRPGIKGGPDIDYSKITYGTDFCNWGYKYANLPVYRAMAKNLYSIVKQDIKGTPIREVPMMREVESLFDVGIVFHCAGSGMISYWIQFVQPDIKFALIGGVTGIMGPEFSPFLSSGQLSGLLIGMGGAYQYEQLMNIEGLGTKGMPGQNFAHMWIILAMILGNVGFFLLKRKRASEEEKGI